MLNAGAVLLMVQSQCQSQILGEQYSALTNAMDVQKITCNAKMMGKRTAVINFTQCPASRD